MTDSQPDIRFDFSAQTAIVTGGIRSIGAAISRSFLAAGADVICTYSANHTAADAFLASLPTEQQQRCRLVCFDIADSSAVSEFFQGLDSLVNPLTILVNNAGIRRDSAAALMSEADWQRVIDVNLTGTFLMCKQALQLFSPRRYGRIINVTSLSGRLGLAGQANYAASKAGTVALTSSIAKETAKRGITINCVSPGFIDTDLISDLSESIRAEYKKSVPVNRFGRTDEVASAVLFLASRAASYITGTTLEVSGGL